MVLLAALLLVYVIFFDVHGDKLRIGWPVEQDTRLTWADIDRMIYIDTTNQVSNNGGSDDVYFPSYYQDTPDLTIPQNEQLIQAQNTQKDPVVVSPPTQQAPYYQDSTWVIEDVQWRRFYSTDFLFGRTDTTDSGINIGTQANPVWASAGVSNTTTAQQTFPTVTTPTTTTNTTWSPSPTVSGIQIANTWAWDGMLTILQSLELDDDVQYILKDINNTHYIYLGKWAGDVSAITSALWGSSLDITDQIVIQNSQLFGTKVTKITMPSYKNNLKELMIIWFANGDNRFLQIDKDWYNQLQNKLSIKQSFEVHY